MSDSHQTMFDRNICTDWRIMAGNNNVKINYIAEMTECQC